MLEIFILVPISLPPHLPISLSINQVKSIATSNLGGFISNSLLQQIYGTDEDVDLKLSDEELELIAENPPQCKNNDNNRDKACSKDSDVLVGGNQIISLQEVLPLANANNHNGIMQLIKDKFRNAGIPISELAVGRLSEHLRAEAPRVTKHEHRGLLINLRTGQECYLDTPGCNAGFLR